MTPGLDPERRLALAYVPAPRRAAVEALWRLDVTLGGVLASGSEPMISRIRLAWWREALERLDRDPPPPEPVLQAVARLVLAAGVSGLSLAEMEEGWSLLADPGRPSRADLDSYATARGGTLFTCTARLLGEDGRDLENAGACWALVDLARRSSDYTEAEEAIAGARERASPPAWPPRLRPLGMLAMLAGRDAAQGLPLERQGSPMRVLRMLRHRLFGY